MDEQDRQPIWRAVRTQCERIGTYANLHDEDMPAVSALHQVVGQLLETLDQVLFANPDVDEELTGEIDPESVQGIVDTLHEYAAERRDAEPVLTEADQAEDRTRAICDGLIRAVFDLRRRQS